MANCGPGPEAPPMYLATVQGLIATESATIFVPFNQLLNTYLPTSPPYWTSPIIAHKPCHFDYIMGAHHEIATKSTQVSPLHYWWVRLSLYILVCYVYNCNAILTLPMKNKSKAEDLCAFNLLHTYTLSIGASNPTINTS
jgi:hypothetical protein